MENKNLDTSKIQFLLATMFLIFMTLKLSGIINWSWVWVTSPLWSPLALAIIVIIFVVIPAWIVEMLITKGDQNDDR